MSFLSKIAGRVVSNGQWTRRHRQTGAVEPLETRDLLTLVVNSFTSIEGATYSSSTIATFNTGDVAGTLADFSATINWGDGSTTVGTIKSDPVLVNTFDVGGTHSYLEEDPAAGPYVVGVTINGTSGSTKNTAGQAAVSDAPLSSTAASIGPRASTPFTGIVGNFHDANPAPTLSDFAATIDWGDGSAASNGTIAPDGLGGFNVIATGHSYVQPGTYTTTVTIRDIGGQATTSLGVASVIPVSQGASLTTSGTTFAVTPGTPFTGTVATFTDTNPAATASNVAAVISWGDGHVSQGMLAGPDKNGIFTVTGTNTYPGTNPSNSYPVTVTITDPSGLTGQAHSTALVNAIVTGVTLTATGTTFAVTPGTAFTGQVATFTDTNPAATASNVTAVITWGDGHVSQGMITGPDKNGIFTVTGTNTYSSTSPSNSFPVTITITDPSGQAATAKSKALVNPGVTSVTLTATGLTFAVTPGVTFTGSVASFTDTNPAATSTNVAAVISWGDGHVSQGTVTGPDKNGIFLVTGTNSYASTNPTNSYPVNVTITDPSGQTAVARGKALVSSSVAPTVVFSGRLDPGPENGPGAASGQFTNSNRPTFSGTTNPFAIVRIFVRPAGVDATIPVGLTAAGPDGRWSLLTGPLANGIYAVFATVAPAGGSPSAPFLVGPSGTIVIDPIPPRLVGVVPLRRQGQVEVSFRDDLSGMSAASLRNVANYTLAGPGAAAYHPASATLLPSPGLPTDTQTVLLTIPVGRRLRFPKLLRINGAGITDNAGNALAGARIGLSSSNPLVALNTRRSRH